MTARARNRKELGVFGPVVVESVDRAARYAEGLARANVERSTVHAPTRDAFEPVDRLLEGVMTVRRRHLAVGRDEALWRGRLALSSDTI